MKRNCLTAMLLSILALTSLMSQELNLENYKKFLDENKNLTSDGLLSNYPPGIYKQTAIKPTGTINYYDSISVKYNLTDYEKELLDEHGFMVSERLKFDSFWSAFADTYYKDLPVFISSDAILHALHMSYDAILKDFENEILIDMLDTILTKLYNHTIILKERYKDNLSMQTMINDYDVYFTVALSLLHGEYEKSNFSENDSTVKILLNYIEESYPFDLSLFSEGTKFIDFSQFTVRGHYTESEKLGKYFKSMMWLGRIELYLIPPTLTKMSFEDIQRQIIDSYLILEAVKDMNINQDIENFDLIIKSLVGESDNVQLHHLDELEDEIGITNITELLDSSEVIKFQKQLATKSYADQKIMSQLFIKSPMDVDQVMPASAFLLFGQRFIIDSYIFHNVTYDRIPAERYLPASLDVIYALGNNAAADFLKQELDIYSYAPNLSATRYLIDSYDSTFWNMSIYNSWLSAIRTLNAPNDSERTNFPEFMKTAAWWQEKMNTQLASWAQLRHDNLLYAKQSYSPFLYCSHPIAYVEPIPKFYQTLGDFARNLNDKTSQILEKFPNTSTFKYGINGYCNKFISTSNTLEAIAEKILKKEELSEDEKTFIRSIYSTSTVDNCGSPGIVLKGWYYDLFYKSDSDNGGISDDGPDKVDYIVADVHTSGEGKIMHIGTGPINLAVVIATGFDQKPTAFVGPVMSYYEYITNNFDRLTDERWKSTFFKNSDITPLRHEIVNLYLADTSGNRRYSNPYSLPVDVEDETNLIEFSDLNAIAYPNPFNHYTNLIFNIRGNELINHLTINIYNISGELIRNIHESKLQNGNYVINWDGFDDNNSEVKAGVYICQFELKGKNYTVKLIKK
ncbi:MAG: DUF3160 domain-containing protein [Ignavibacteriae bacterium]|nr:DUF3160 domain-containing protein [Ignavibacteriota bacterium]